MRVSAAARPPLVGTPECARQHTVVTPRPTYPRVRVMAGLEQLLSLFHFGRRMSNFLEFRKSSIDAFLAATAGRAGIPLGESTLADTAVSFSRPASSLVCFPQVQNNQRASSASSRKIHSGKNPNKFQSPVFTKQQRATDTDLRSRMSR
jgi:hypothetical protein